MGVPIGNTACVYRLRPAMHLQALCEHMGFAPGEPSGVRFRENLEKTGNVNKL
jgi:hypothetical protein